MAAAQGIDFLAPLAPGNGTGAAHKAIREIVPHLDEDRSPSPDIENVYQIINSGLLLKQVEAVTGSLRL